jgi:hypothetical protein
MPLSGRRRSGIYRGPIGNLPPMNEYPRLKYSFSAERIERLKATPEFQDIATSTKKGREREKAIRSGESVRREIVLLLEDMDGRRVYHDRDEFRQNLESLFRGFIKFPDYFWDVLMDALSEPDDSAGADPRGESSSR